MTSRKLSLYRTQHEFLDYREILSKEEAISAMVEVSKQSYDYYILGNGSNTFFIRKNIQTLIIKNSLPREIVDLGGDEFYVSSSTLVSEVLKSCFANQRDCFYYLSSVPAEVGGALAMNAGQGLAYGGASIMDFVKEVRFVRDGEICLEPPGNLSISYRKTAFTGKNNFFILGATFIFPKVDSFEENPIKTRIAWAKASQDLSKPNCGTVFKTVNMKILNRFRGLSLFGATYSKKTNNWIINESINPFGIRILIFLVTFCHKILFQKCETEVIRIK